ncbi:MAG TPA: cytochrome P450 [Verrucomicrobiae bacterium]|nr:cytochrome P450 [Verrucomicrobiae bacterium]
MQPRFDPTVNAWIVSRYRNVVRALNDPRFSADEVRGEEHARFRTEGSAIVLSAMQKLVDLRPVTHLPRDRPVDVMQKLARTWSEQAAMLLFPVHGDPDRALALAAEVFAAAAGLNRADQATRELAALVEAKHAAFHVQGFVALSQTLPCFLANAWLALLRNPEQMQMLRDSPELMPAAIEELLRFAGPARAQLRRATEDLEFCGAQIKSGDRVALMLASANRDPDQFPDPDRLDLRRNPQRHVAFGAGPHACIGAPLVRAAAALATAAFIKHFTGAEIEEPLEWGGGFAIRAPASLRVSTAPSSALPGTAPSRSPSGRTPR